VVGLEGHGPIILQHPQLVKYPDYTQDPLQNRGGGEQTAQACANAWFQQLTVRLAQGRFMKIAELKGLPNWQATAVDNQTGHAIAIVRAGNDGYHVIRGEVRRGAFNLLRSVGGLGADYCEVGQC